MTLNKPLMLKVGTEYINLYQISSIHPYRSRLSSTEGVSIKMNNGTEHLFFSSKYDKSRERFLDFDVNSFKTLMDLSFEYGEIPEGYESFAYVDEFT